MFERKRILVLLMIVLCILLYLSRVDLQGNDVSNQMPGFSFNPPPDSLIQELIIQVADSNLTASIQRLQDFWTRDVFSDSIALSSYWISDKLTEFGYTDVEFDSFEVDSLTLWNVVATKTGYGDSARVIVIGGHYDSAGFDSTLQAPGADDNASGVASTLEIARILSDVPLYDTVKFISFSCEEYGREGSANYAWDAVDEGMDIELMINLDMIANQDSTNFVKVCVDTTFQSNDEDVLYAVLMINLGLNYTTIEPKEIHRFRSSDDLYFMLNGFNALFVWEYDFNPYYHTPDDLLEHLEIPFLREVTKMALATVVTVAQHQSEPSGIDDHIIDGPGLPRAFVLNQNYPNPFNPTTTITFFIPESYEEEKYVSLSVYDLRGKLVKTLIAEGVDSGFHKIVWDGHNENGQQVSSGIYLYTLKYGNTVYIRKMILVE